jgi:hypothetical protein
MDGCVVSGGVVRGDLVCYDYGWVFCVWWRGAW